MEQQFSGFEKAAITADALNIIKPHMARDLYLSEIAEKYGFSLEPDQPISIDEQVFAINSLGAELNEHLKKDPNLDRNTPFFITALFKNTELPINGVADYIWQVTIPYLYDIHKPSDPNTEANERQNLASNSNNSQLSEPKNLEEISELISAIDNVTITCLKILTALILTQPEVVSLFQSMPNTKTSKDFFNLLSSSLVPRREFRRHSYKLPIFGVKLVPYLCYQEEEGVLSPSARTKNIMDSATKIISAFAAVKNISEKYQPPQTTSAEPKKPLKTTKLAPGGNSELLKQTTNEQTLEDLTQKRHIYQTTSEHLTSLMSGSAKPWKALKNELVHEAKDSLGNIYHSGMGKERAQQIIQLVMLVNNSLKQSNEGHGRVALEIQSLATQETQSYEELTQAINLAREAHLRISKELVIEPPQLNSALSALEQYWSNVKEMILKYAPDAYEVLRLILQRRLENLAEDQVIILPK